MRPKIVFTNVSKSFNLYKKQSDKLMEVISFKGDKSSFYALKNLSFKIYEGEAIGIVGLNGSGKSTLSNLLGQIIPSSSGTIEINGETSLIAISAGLNNQLSGLENIELKCLMHGLKKEEIQRVKSEIIDFADIGKFIDQPVKNYSSGMKSRLGFAISIHTNPDILIVDEALSVGDQTFYEKCLLKINEFKSQGKTIIFVSHSTSQIKAFCDRVMWIHFGKIEEFGDAETVIGKYKQFIKWFNSLNETEKKQYKIKMLDNQYNDDMKENNFSPFGRQSYRKRKSKERKKGNLPFIFQCFVLLLAIVTSASIMFGANPVKSVGNYISNTLSEDSLIADKAIDKSDSQKDIKKVEAAEAVNKTGILLAGESPLYEDSDLKEQVGQISFAEEFFVVEKSGKAVKIQLDTNNMAYTNVENVTILDEDLPVSQMNFTEFLPLFPERFVNAYSYFLTFLNSESEEVKSTLKGLTNEESLDNGEKTLAYSIYDAMYTINNENIAESITISNIGTNLDQWNELKDAATFISNDGKYYFYKTKQFKIVIDLTNQKATVSLVNQ
ncbi:ATP-binding cassette domain-containing protein [Neobacillus vireti]|uniref:ATP-binding cassette domain-containing protein n=1 Tax=Neobacillus vireti TaxID=220686 RepID=UPI003000E2EA